MWISCEHPGWLALLLLLAPIWWMAWRGIAGFGLTRCVVSASVRSLVVLLLVAALSQPSLVESNDGVTVVVVADASRSVPAATRGAAQQWLQERAADRPSPRDRLGVVTFAKSAEIQSKPETIPKVSLSGHASDAAGSDLAAGVRMAMALMPRDTRKRVVLLSDGNETSGSVLEAAQVARSAGVAIDVVPLEVGKANDTMVEALRVPTRARRGQNIDAKLVVRARQPTDGRIRFEIDGEAVDLDSRSDSNAMAVHLDTGPNIISIPVALPRSGVIRMKAIFEPRIPGDDAVAENNVASAITFVSGEGRLLIVDDSGNETRAFADALRASKLDVLVAGAAILSDPTVAGSFDAIVLANVSRWSIDQAADQSIETAVRDFGVGLLMLGGDHSFGAGGWAESQTAKALPVEMNPPKERQIPKGALALIIDCSGSMAMPVAGSNMDQQQCANEAAIQGIRSLSPGDEVTVIAFSGQSRVVVPLTSAEQPEAIAHLIRTIVPTGGTNLFPALDLAAKELEGSNRAVKHIVVLTDGQTEGDPNEGIRRVTQLARRGITLSTVSIGDSTNDPLLVQMAKVGGGNCYPVKAQNAQVTLPQIFIKEAMVLNRSLLAEGSFAPSMTGPSPPGVPLTSPVPQVAGYVITAPRGGLSQNALSVSSNEKGSDPLFAWWNYGVGRSAAFTSDLSSRWGGAWVRWSGYQPWCAGLARWLLRQSAPLDTSLTTQLDGDDAMVELSVRDDDDAAATTSVATAKVLRPDGTVAPLSLRQKTPGRWSAKFPTDEAGAYLVNAALKQGSSERPVFVQAAVNVSYPREFRFQREDQAKLAQVAAVSGGRVLKLGDPAVQLFDAGGTLPAESLRQLWDILLYAATGLFVLDVAARRLVFEKRSASADAKVVVGQVAQAWKTARQRAAGETARASAPVAAPRVAPQRAAAPASVVELDEPIPEAPVATREPEIPLDQLSPLERLREAKRRAQDQGGSS
ncbi:MAG: VWA domain-containing protein [Planctomycetes bacterium]|nr:VWA domain-containing protein [Planctomycetota bacterium]